MCTRELEVEGCSLKCFLNAASFRVPQFVSSTLALASPSNLCPGRAAQKECAADNGVRIEGQQEGCLSLESVTTSLSQSTTPGLIHLDRCISKDGWIQHIFRINRYYILSTRQNTEVFKHRYSQMVLVFRRPLTDRKVGKRKAIKFNKFISE